MQPNAIRKIVIVGGGTAGWMCAASLSKFLGTVNQSITLVESDEIGTVGVGEATIPMLSVFNKALGIDEDDFMRETNATFKLGIRFVDWSRPGADYFHPFGLYGSDMDGIGFAQYWMRLWREGGHEDYGRFSLETMAYREGLFARTPANDPSGLPKLNYAYHFDAGLFAQYLRRFAERRGVARQEGKIVRVEQHPQTGFVTAVELEDGQRVQGDLFIDCSGFRALLIEGALKTGFEDWSHWLPCDRAVAVPCASVGPLTPYTRATARQAGWQWRIPLQHRIGNGHVFSSKFMSEDEATAVLMGNLDGAPMADPRTLRFQTGRRLKSWNRNVVSIGLASGFIEPLESTSIHLVQMGISHLLTYFPSNGFDAAVTDEFNRLMKLEFEWVRDFVVLHYKATERTDTPFWNYCREMSVPPALEARMNLFKVDGRVFRDGEELFGKPSWLQVMHGQRLRPARHHPLADLLGEQEVANYLEEVAGVIGACVDVMPTHAKFIADHCAAPPIKAA